MNFIFHLYTGQYQCEMKYEYSPYMQKQQNYIVHISLFKYICVFWVYKNNGDAKQN